MTPETDRSVSATWTSGSDSACPGCSALVESLGQGRALRRATATRFGRPAHYGTREFAQLSHSFLDMAEQLSRRSDYIATFSSHLTHELKSRLTSIKGAAELLLDSLQSKADTLTRMEQLHTEHSG